MLNVTRKLLLGAMAATALVSVGGLMPAVVQAQTVSQFDTLTQQAAALADSISTTQAQGGGTAAQKTKLTQLARNVSQLRANIAAAGPQGSSGELAFLADELASLQKQVQVVVAAIGGGGSNCASSLPAAGWATAGVNYQVSAVDPKIIRVRVGSRALPEDASWAVLPNARTALACSTSSTAQTLTTNALKVTVDGSGLITVADTADNVLWKDAAAPVFNADGSFNFKGAIPAGSNFYGLGDKTDSIDKSGKSFVNENLDNGGYGMTSDPLYRSIPFFIRRTANGVYTGYLLDNTWRSTFDFGKTAPGTIAMGSSGGGIDYYVIAGSSPKEILQNYAKLTGATPLPNLWALGWQQSKYSYMSATEASGIANGYRSRNIPADVIWLDIGFQYKNYPFVVGDSYKPFNTFVQNMLDIDFKTVVITDLHIAKNPSIGPYTAGHDKGYFVKDKDGAEFSGKVWPDDVNAVFPDFTRKPARDWWGSLFKEFYVDNKVAGFWNDMNEPVVFNSNGTLTMPADNIHGIEEPGFLPRSTTHREVRNIFGMQNSRGTYEGQLALKSNQRPFVMTRASYAGGQRYAVTWTGDNLATFEHLRIATNQIASLGLAGFHSAADIGGYRGTPSALLLTRWIQIGSFYPISRDHAETNKPPQEPWVNGTQADFDMRAKYIRNRYALMPYFYTLAEETSRTGTPILRRMFLEFPNAKSPDNANVPIDVAGETQFLVGPSVLVAPSSVEQGFRSAAVNNVGTLLEAERMALTGGASIATDHTGYTGTGFVAGLQNAAPRISFKVSGVATAGEYALQLRYSNYDSGNGQLVNRTMSVLVDGVSAGQVTFTPTASWDAWNVVSKTLQLGAGDHDIVLARVSPDTGNINVDSMAVTAVGAAYPAPSAPAAEGFDVLLPPGKWYDYWSGAALAEPSGGTASSWKYRVASSAPTELPVFVRGGSIIPRVPAAALSAVKSTVDVAKITELELSVYPGDNCKGTIYVDDGTSFAFKTGAYYRRNYTCTTSGGTTSVQFGAVEGTFRPSWTTVKVVGYTGTTPVSKVVAESAGPSEVALTP